MGTLDSDLGPGAHFINILAREQLPFDVVTGGAFSEAGFISRRALLAGAHGVAIVLDDVDHREIPETRKVQGFVKSTLINGSVSEVA